MTTNPLPPPSSPYGQFDEKGYHFEARIPAGPHERRASLLIVSREGQPLLEVDAEMLYAPVYGVDTGDAALLEDVTNKLLDILPEAALTEEHYARLEKELGARRPPVISQ
jgi:hypothetical protein